MKKAKHCKYCGGLINEDRICTECGHKFFKIRIKKDAGNVVEYLVQPRNKRLGILLVPKMVKQEDILGVGADDLKKVLEELREKK